MMDGSEPSMLTAALVSALALGGALVTLIGTVGLVRLETFVQRVHSPTMGTTLGTSLVLLGSMLLATVSASRPVVHEIAIGIFMTLTTPVTFMLLFRAAVLRSRPESPNDPGRADPAADDGPAVRLPIEEPPERQ